MSQLAQILLHLTQVMPIPTWYHLAIETNRLSVVGRVQLARRQSPRGDLSPRGFVFCSVCGFASKQEDECDGRTDDSGQRGREEGVLWL